MATQLPQGMTAPQAVGAKKLGNGGVVYELDKQETADWVRREKAAFMAGFGGTAVVRERATSVIVKFVPVAHSPDALAKNRRIEGNSRLEEGVLLTTRWIKPLQRRTPGQKAMHLIVRFKMDEAVNATIKDGLVIAGKRVCARWMKKEPRRCLKCQSLTVRHLAARCNQQIVCGTCSKDLHTAECVVTDKDAFWCTSCKASGHTS